MLFWQPSCARVYVCVEQNGGEELQAVVTTWSTSALY